MALVTTALALLVATTSPAQTPVSNSRLTKADSDNLSSIAGQNQPSPDKQASGQLDSPPGTQDKKRLAVNPVTGLVTSSGSNYAPLTGRERWKVYWKMNFFSVGAYFGPVVTAAVLDQTTDDPPEWGPGIGGYGLRLASRTANGVIQGTVQAPAAALLHEDVRYIASGRGGFGHRTLHALEYSVLTYNDRGRPTVNIANLGSYYASTAISSTWLPGKRSLVGYTLSNGTEQIGLSVSINMVQEFWPEITRSIFHRHSP